MDKCMEGLATLLAVQMEAMMSPQGWSGSKLTPNWKHQYLLFYTLTEKSL